MKTYHFGMIPEKGSSLKSLLKIGLVAGGAYLAYQRLYKGANNTQEQSPNAGTVDFAGGADAAAREAGDFAAKVLKAAKRIPEAVRK